MCANDASSRYGARNSLLLAPMPTASTAQILGFNECIEPYTSNLYARRVKVLPPWTMIAPRGTAAASLFSYSTANTFEVKAAAS